MKNIALKGKQGKKRTKLGSRSCTKMVSFVKLLKVVANSAECSRG
jgi:hypothetical protein